MLIFRNQKFAANGVLLDQVVKELNTRSQKYNCSFTITSTQARNKFKKLISECKTVSLTQCTASGTSRYKVESYWTPCIFTCSLFEKGTKIHNGTIYEKKTSYSKKHNLF